MRCEDCSYFSGYVEGKVARYDLKGNGTCSCNRSGESVTSVALKRIAYTSLVQVKSTGTAVSAKDISRIEQVSTKVHNVAIHGLSIYVTGSITFPVCKVYFKDEAECETVYTALLVWLTSQESNDPIFVLEDTCIG